MQLVAGAKKSELISKKPPQICTDPPPFIAGIVYCIFPRQNLNSTLPLKVVKVSLVGACVQYSIKGVTKISIFDISLNIIFHHTYTKINKLNPISALKGSPGLCLRAQSVPLGLPIQNKALMVELENSKFSLCNLILLLMVFIYTASDLQILI